jgi:hypothetical protein
LLQIEGTWAVRSSFWDGQIRCIEAERLEHTLNHPPLPEDAEVWFNSDGCVKKSATPAGANRNAQAQEAQYLFNQTLQCSPLSNAGDHWEIICSKVSIFPITIIHNNERIRSWVDNTSVKSIQEEARRLLGDKLKVDRVIDEPGLAYKTSKKSTRSQKPKPEITTKNRSVGKVKLSSPSIARRDPLVRLHSTLVIALAVTLLPKGQTIHQWALKLKS